MHPWYYHQGGKLTSCPAHQIRNVKLTGEQSVFTEMRLRKPCRFCSISQSRSVYYSSSSSSTSLLPYKTQSLKCYTSFISSSLYFTLTLETENTNFSFGWKESPWKKKAVSAHENAQMVALSEHRGFIFLSYEIRLYSNRQFLPFSYPLFLEQTKKLFWLCPSTLCWDQFLLLQYESTIMRLYTSVTLEGSACFSQISCLQNSEGEMAAQSFSSLTSLL